MFTYDRKPSGPMAAARAVSTANKAAAPPAGGGAQFDVGRIAIMAGAPRLQRACASCEREDEEVAAGTMQRKVADAGIEVGSPDDPSEREADRVASAVIGGSPPVHGRVGGGARDRWVAPPIVGDVLRSEGAPLDADTLELMETRIGHDFSRVRVHTDERADASTRAVNAVAYTVGPNIAFRRGHYDPSGSSGRHLLAHELTHVAQQGSAGVLRRTELPAAGPVTSVRISCEDMRIVLDTASGSYSYRMTQCNIPVGEYTVGVRLARSSFHFDFGPGVADSERFRFGFRIEPGQVNPVDLLRGQSSVPVSVVDHLPVREAGPSQAAPPAASLETRLASFKHLVKQAAKLRVAQNSRALDAWHTFFERELTPAQVQSQLQAEEARRVIATATSSGMQETALADQWLRTRGPHARQVMQQQIEGRYRACTGCHASVQASRMDRDLAGMGYQFRSPLEQLGSAEPGPRPSFPVCEQLSPSRASDAFPAVQQAQDRINAIRPYVRMLGPEGYRVLPAETLSSAATPSALVADISARIRQRQADYRTFSQRIDDPSFDYLNLRPVVRELLPLADADVRQAVLDSIESAENWAIVENIVVGLATIGLLILMIFPPTTALGIGGALALGTALGAHQAYRGYQSFELGRTYSLGVGAHDVIDPSQQEAADALMAMGALNMILGAIGVASGVLGGVRLIRALPPPGGGLGAVEAIEANAGGDLVRVTGWGSRDPHVRVTGPSGQLIHEGPLSSYRPAAPRAAAVGPRAQAQGSGGGGMQYPMEGGAARVAQPVPDPVVEVAPVPEVAPQPQVAPSVPPVRPPLPDPRGTLGVMAGTRGAGDVATAMAGAPGRVPVMPPGLSPAMQRLWRECNQLHTTYKATQDEAGAFATTMDPIEDALHNSRATAQQRLDFCLQLDQRIRIVQRLHAERLRYINRGCDVFDWFNEGRTQAEREADHRTELANVATQLRNFYALRRRFCP